MQHRQAAVLPPRWQSKWRRTEKSTKPVYEELPKTPPQPLSLYPSTPEAKPWTSQSLTQILLTAHRSLHALGCVKATRAWWAWKILWPIPIIFLVSWSIYIKAKPAAKPQGLHHPTKLAYPGYVGAIRARWACKIPWPIPTRWSISIKAKPEAKPRAWYSPTITLLTAHRSLHSLDVSRQ